MNARTLSLFAGLLLASAGAASCQPAPANDDFANRTVLAGASATAAGTLVGATLESGEPANACSTAVSGGSVWWTWTAPVSSAVVIAMSWNSSLYNPYNSWLQVCAGTNLSSLTELDCNQFDWQAGRYVKFAATAGVSYQFRVFGAVAAAFHFQLTATNPPVMVVPPRNCTNSPYGSAFFYAVAAGLPSPSLQWKFNGTALEGETNAMLTVYNVLSNQAGIYSVVASNSGGITEKAATLTVTQTNPVPWLAASVPSDPARFAFVLSGEDSRWYKIESSSDLAHWSNPGAVLYTNVAGSLAVPRFDPAHQFVRASVNVAADICGARMKQWRVAMNLWAIEHKRNLSQGFVFAEVRTYFPGGIAPFCPDGGTYLLYGGGVTNVFPNCTLDSSRGHVMLDPP